MKTSLKLSKWLQVNGFERESELVRLNGEEEIRHKRQDNLYNPVPVYDILNDLCVIYKNELFGSSANQITQSIFRCMQNGRKDDAEKIIKENLRVVK